MKKSIRKFVAFFCCAVFFLMGVGSVFAEPAANRTLENASAQENTSIRNRKKIAFICLDGTARVTPRMRNLWQRQVRQAYPRARYEFIEDPQVIQNGRDVIFANGGVDGTVDPIVLSQVADKTGADVVALMVIRTMEEYYVESFFLGFDDGPEMYLRVITGADLYLYKKDGDKYRKKKLRKVETTDVALAVSPYIEIRNAMSDLARSFEGLPLI